MFLEVCKDVFCTSYLFIYSFVHLFVNRDDDMISNFSHVSDDDEEYRKHTLSLDEDISGTVINCPTHKAVRNLAVIQSRAVQ